MSRSFAGGTNQVAFADSADYDWTSNVTIACWIYRDNDSNRFGVAGHTTGGSATNGWWFSIKKYDGGLNQNEGQFTFNDNDHVTSANFVGANSWTHIAATSDGSNVRFYKNGVLFSTVGTSHTNNNSSASLTIGRHANYYSTESADGDIEQFFMYNVALNASEIKALMERSRPVRWTSCKIWAPLYGIATEVNFKNRAQATLTGTSQGVGAPAYHNLLQVTPSYVPAAAVTASLLVRKNPMRTHLIR